MLNLAQVIYSGLILGLIYMVIGLGYQATYSTSKTLNFGQGESVALGGLLGYSLVPHLTFWGAIPFAALGGAALGLFTYYAAVAPALKKGVESSWMVATIALGPLLLKNLYESVWGKDDLSVASPFSDSPLVIGIRVLPMEIFVVVVVLAIVAGLGLFMTKTRYGKAVTAVAINRDTAELMGIASTFVVTGSFALSGAMAGIAGLLVSPLTTASATMGLVIGLKGFQAAVIGGLTSARGLVIGALGIGVLDQLTAYLISSQYKDVPGLILMLLIMSFKPTGLFGAALIKKV